MQRNGNPPAATRGFRAESFCVPGQKYCVLKGNKAARVEVRDNDTGTYQRRESHKQSSLQPHDTRLLIVLPGLVVWSLIRVDCGTVDKVLQILASSACPRVIGTVIVCLLVLGRGCVRLTVKHSRYVCRNLQNDRRGDAGILNPPC